MGDIKFIVFDYSHFIEVAELALPTLLFNKMMASNHIMKMKSHKSVGPSIYNCTNLDTVLSYHSRIKIDYDPDFNLSFNDVANARAKEIIDRAIREDKKIKILYSGGIDSTTILVAILQNIAKSEIHRLVVILSVDSIRENAYVFDKIVRQLPIESYAEYNDKPLEENSLYISGVSADGRIYGLPKNNLFSASFDHLALTCPVPCEGTLQKTRWVYINYYGNNNERQTVPNYLKRKGYAKLLSCTEAEKIEKDIILYYESPDFCNYVLTNLDDMTVGQKESPKAVALAYVSDYLGETYHRFEAGSGGDYCSIPQVNYWFAVDSDYNFYHRYDEEFITELAHKFIAAG